MDLLKEDEKKLYFKFLLPSLGSAMVMSIYTITDAIVIGQGVGSDALAALSITTPLLCVLMAIGIMFGVGGSVHMNIKVGQGDKKSANMYFTESLMIISAFTLVLWLIYGIFMPEIARLMGANNILYPYVMDYMRYIIMFLPVTTMSNFLAIFVRADNNPNKAMLGVICGGVFNIFLDILLVMKLNWGIGGAAFASVIGMCIQVSVSLSHFCTKKSTIKLVLPTQLWIKARDIFSGGFSGLLNELANGIIVFLFNIQILKFCGTDALAVYSVISNCVILFNSLFTGVGQAVIPIISINYGAKKKERIKRVTKMAYINIAVMGIVFSLVGMLFPHEVCSIFTKETQEIYAVADYGIRLYFIAFFPMAINLLTSYYLQAILRTRESVAISMLRNIILSTGMIIILPGIIGKNILWIIMPIVESLVMLLCIFLMKNKEKVKRK